MLVSVFALGRPGCGKSIATRHMNENISCSSWEKYRIRDYDILYDLFKRGDQRFRPAEHDGFNVVEFSVMDDVLSMIQKKIKALESTASTKDIFITVEFARNNYYDALKLFDLDFLQRSHFLFIDSDLETCIQRIHERVKNPDILDNHFVSEEILRGYYGGDNLAGQDQFSAVFNIEPQRVKVIENDGSLDEFLKEVDRFLQEIMPLPALT